MGCSVETQAVYLMRNKRRFYVWVGKVKKYSVPPKDSISYKDHNDALMDALETSIETGMSIVEVSVCNNANQDLPKVNVASDYKKSWEFLTKMGVPCCDPSSGRTSSLSKRIKIGFLMIQAKLQGLDVPGASNMIVAPSSQPSVSEDKKDQT